MVDALATLNQVGFSHHVHSCLVSSRNQLQRRFEEGADVSVPTLCEVWDQLLDSCWLPGLL